MRECVSNHTEKSLFWSIQTLYSVIDNTSLLDYYTSLRTFSIDNSKPETFSRPTSNCLPIKLYSAVFLQSQTNIENPMNKASQSFLLNGFTSIFSEMDIRFFPWFLQTARQVNILPFENIETHILGITRKTHPLLNQILTRIFLHIILVTLKFFDFLLQISTRSSYINFQNLYRKNRIR